MNSKIALYNFAIYFLQNLVFPMRFGPILADLLPFLSRTPAKI